MEIVMVLIGVSILFNIILFGLILVIWRDVISTRLLTSNTVVNVHDLTRSIGDQSTLTNRLGQTITEFINTTGEWIEKTDFIISMLNSNGREGRLYKTTDGKYTAGSFEELVNKIKNDGLEEKYFNGKDIEELKKLFEDDLDDEDDEEDGDHPQF